ncbi:hypothetical protein NM688_g7620 [Phlebia brevispora]|uniref:Uncharacterized protein n=1 Tax=Phlebia brevispora TaxID=194682 RepID=A0ACC1S329_9APHY|nr:hypothetical protein NM688_g7620 [Phlebia brevispora]
MALSTSAASSLHAVYQDHIQREDLSHISRRGDDGSVRLYNLPSTTVVRAIRGLGSEVSSICWTVSPKDDSGEVWLACGTKALLFRINQQEIRSKLVLSLEDASDVLSVTKGDDCELNELSISPSKQYMAYSTDDGEVGVIDLTTREKETKPMKTRHASVCACVKFIPDRPSELVSGGYDSALLHFDFKQSALLSRYDIVPPDPPSMTMPFIISVSVSVAGVIAAALADGRIWIGTGGAKASPSAGKQKPKRSRKWEGLRDSAGCYTQIASGPVVASAFTPDGALLTCSLLGKLAQHTITYDDEKVEVRTIWSGEIKTLHKVSAIAVSEKWFAVAGFGTDDKGLVEIWCPTQGVSEDMEQLSIANTQTTQT